MKHTFLLSSLLVFSFSMGLTAQTAIDGEKVLVGKRSEIKKAQKVASIEGDLAQDEWMTVLKKTAIYHSKGDSIDVMKLAKRPIRESVPLGIGNESNGRAVTPTIGTGITGTTMNSYTPPDNTMAISNNGRLVAVDNEDISYFNETGTQTGVATHTSFFSGLITSSYLFDPRVWYDSEEDRFIYVLLHGTSYSNSKIFVCFSKSNDPENDGWEIYSLPGNPLSDYSWTDYPNIGVSGDELFITTNLFYSNNSFNQSIIYQIDKMDGYNGLSSVDYSVWDDVFDGNGGKAFTIVPASYGHQGSYGSNMYFTSSRPGGSTRIYLYEITDNMNGNPQLTADDILADYEVAADGNQLGSSSLMDVGDCRMQHAFYLNGIVHTVHAGDYLGTGYCGIFYYRIPVDNTSQTEEAVFGESGFDYAYPSLASFGLSECDKGVMIGALRTGSSIYPQMRVMNCDQDMQWSSSTQIVSGSSPISFIGNPERWGDYSTMQRKHSATSPEVWMSGCHTSSSNRYVTRLAEIKGTYVPAEGPGIDFYSNDSLGTPTYFVNFYDNSSNNPTAWEWTFEGGIPNVSTQQNPLVSYLDTGSFDVRLIAWNDDCFDSLTVEDMIHVVEFIPGDTDTVDLGGFIVYIVDGDTYQLFNGEIVPLGQEEIAAVNNRVFPNPLSTAEMMYVELELLEGTMLTGVIYDMQGRAVKTLFTDYVKPGKHELGFNKLALSSGQYILQVKSDSELLINEKIIIQR